MFQHRQANRMLCIWWDQLGVVHYGLLKANKIITKALYRTQLVVLSRELKFKKYIYVYDILIIRLNFFLKITTFANTSDVTNKTIFCLSQILKHL